MSELSKSPTAESRYEHTIKSEIQPFRQQACCVVRVGRALHDDNNRDGDRLLLQAGDALLGLCEIPVDALA